MKKTFLLSFALFSALLLARPATTHASTVTVENGDTLWSYSQKYDVSVQAIAKANNIDLSHYMMWQGDKINIPDGKPYEDGAQFNNHFSNGAQAQAVAKPSVQAQPVQQPVQQAQTQQQAPVQQAKPVQQPVQQQAPATSGDASAKAWISARESGGSYTAQNGRYYGKYQLDSSYLHGDYSPANQERVATQYVQSRYNGWSNAKSHWEAYGWY